jgi:predicted NAD/FAD-binding protein
MKIAIVGAGISGLMAARLLGGKHEVTVFEASDRLGGHARTVDVWADGRSVAVDTGFIVYNERNYPLLSQLFAELGVATEESDMSFSFSLNGGEFEYAGNARGLLAQPLNGLRPAFWRMLHDIRRFNRSATQFMKSAARPDATLGEFLATGRYSPMFLSSYLLPMASAIWSSRPATIERFPMRSFAGFFWNHGLLSIRGRPRWRTVTGGSRSYVERLVRSLRADILPNRPVRRVERPDKGIVIWLDDGSGLRFDQVVMATPANVTARLLGTGSSQRERDLLGAFQYCLNDVVLHSDTRLMPRRRSAWASWNYLGSGPPENDRGAAVTYWMNKLQNLPTTRPLLASLNPPVEPRAELVHDRTTFSHPQFDSAALAAQSAIGDLQGNNRTWYCGSYLGYGFHEDAVRSSHLVAAGIDSREATDHSSAALLGGFQGSQAA